MRWSVVHRPRGSVRTRFRHPLLAALLVGIAVIAAVQIVPADTAQAESAQPCRVAPAPEHARGWKFGDLGCPSDVASPVEAAEQFFELGVMLWRGDVRTIYALSSQGGAAFSSLGVPPDRGDLKASGADDPAWRSFPDLFYEGQPEYAGYTSPDERLQEPVRGFGKVWREQLGGPSARLGWATTYERRVWAAVQPFERGLILRTDTGRVYVLRNNGTWASYRT